MNQAKQEEPRRRKRYTEEFKRSVVDHWQSSGKTGAKVAQEFGVNLWNLRDWRRQVDGPIPQSPEEMSREIKQLRKELARVMMQRDILKKTWASCPKARGALPHGRGDG